MSITEFSVLPTGARVKVRRGRYPMDPSLEGRSGTVLEHSPYTPGKVAVTLDGESQIRTVATEELAVVEGAEALPADIQAARKRLSRP